MKLIKILPNLGRKAWLFVNQWSVVILVIATIYFFYNTNKSNGSVVTSTYRVQYEKEAELAYWNARYLLNCEVQHYIDSVAPTSNLRAYDLIELTTKYDIDIKFVLAQGEIESHFGTKGLASRTNSVWNVGAYDGLSESKISSRHKFSHPNESIEPYLKLLTTKYMVDGKLEIDLMRSFTTKGGARYASAKDYEIRLKNCYDYVSKNTRIEDLTDQLRYYAIKCGRF